MWISEMEKDRSERSGGKREWKGEGGRQRKCMNKGINKGKGGEGDGGKM